jgi:hypothetical protein
MAGKSGVYPCYDNQFKIGKTSAENAIADMETFSVSFDNGVEEWTPYDTEGWVRRLMTGKGITISVNGKRNVGDAGNDFVAGLAMKNGREAEAYFEWALPDGSKIAFENAVINIKNIGAGESTGVGPLGFDVMSNGKPTYTPAA